MEAIFTAIPQQGKLSFVNKTDIEKYCIENDGIELAITMKPLAKIAEKERMMHYLFGPLLDCAVIGFGNAGYEGMDKVKALYFLEAEFCKGVVFNTTTNQENYYILRLSGMNKQRLLKFIVDCCFYIQAELGQEVPDSETYRSWIETGQKLKSTKFLKKKE